MTGTFTPSQKNRSDEPFSRRCVSAESAVVRWAMAHLEAHRFGLPAVVRDDAAESDENA